MQCGAVFEKLKVLLTGPAANAWADIATGIVYQPMSRLVASLTSGNLLSNAASYTSDYELSQCQVNDGATALISRSYQRGDALNITGITDQVAAANNQSFAANPANRLNSAVGPWGTKSYTYDGVGNRTFENTTVGGVTTSDNLQYPATSNRVQSIVRNTTTDGADVCIENFLPVAILCSRLMILSVVGPMPEWAALQHSFRFLGCCGNEFQQQSVLKGQNVPSLRPPFARSSKAFGGCARRVLTPFFDINR